MEVKGPRISKREAAAIAAKIPVKRKISLEQFRKGVEVEQEHGKKMGANTNVTKGNLVKTGKIALAHIKEIPDYYTRLAKMEKQAKRVHEVDDEIERRHNATNARILLGAKQGKYWLNRSESLDESFRGKVKVAIDRFKNKKKNEVRVPWRVASALYGPPNRKKGGNEGGSPAAMRTEDRKELIRRILETTTSAAIGGVPMPMAGKRSDPAFGGRNRFRDKNRRKTDQWFASLCRTDA